MIGVKVMRSSSYSEVRMILLGLDEISEIQFNRLIDVYGLEIVSSVIKDLAMVDERILKKVDKFVYKLRLNLNSNKKIVSLYDHYVADITNISDISLDVKKELIEEIVEIIKKLNELFVNVGNIVCLHDEKQKPWISDKVAYCLEKCEDKELLGKINSLYMEYIKKRNILVESNLRFVIFITKLYYKKCGLEMNDLIQYGNMGLMRAVETYNPNFDAGFTTYARYWIKQSIIRNSQKNMYPYRIPTHLFEDNNKRLTVINELTDKYGRVPKDIEVADYMGISVEKIKRMVDLFIPVVSLDEPIESSIDGTEITRIELIPDENVNIEEDVFYREMLDELNNYMYNYLNDREIYILRNMYGFDDIKTQNEIASVLDISRQRVDQIKTRALEKLRGGKIIRSMKSYLR